MRRDLGWRTLGAAFYALGCAAAVATFDRDAPGPTLLGVAGLFVGVILAALGVGLLAQGRRVVQSLRIERSGHRDLPQAIRRRQLRRERD